MKNEPTMGQYFEVLTHGADGRDDATTATKTSTDEGQTSWDRRDKLQSQSSQANCKMSGRAGYQARAQGRKDA